MAAVGNPDLIRNLKRNRSRSPRGESISKLARVLDVSESWLLGTTDDPGVPIVEAERGIRYGGIVEAGAFRPVELLNQDADHKFLPLSPDPRFPAKDQYAFEVVGDSMNLARILPGMLVQAVDVYAWERLHGEPGDGKLVIVARTRSADPERELTVKRLRIFRDRIELRPESDNPVHKPLAYPNPPREGEDMAVVIAVVLKSIWQFT